MTRRARKWVAIPLHVPEREPLQECGRGGIERAPVVAREENARRRARPLIGPAVDERLEAVHDAEARPPSHLHVKLASPVTA